MSSSRRPWYKWFPKDFRTDEKVQSLGPISELVYRRLLDVMWQNSACLLLNDCQRLANTAANGLTAEQFEKAWSEIQTPGFELFKITDDGHWIYSKRLHEQLEELENKQKAGKKGGLARGKQNLSRTLAELKQKAGNIDTDTDIEKICKKENPQKGKTALPTNFTITQEMITWFKDQNYTFSLKAETDRFIDHFKAKGEMKKDWVAAWRNWMRNHEKFARNQRPQYTTGYEANVPRQPVFDGVKRYAD